ncbi:hypothetical protein EG830_12495 [bacterium]|nr:hypothetical protein [bacterium]
MKRDKRILIPRDEFEEEAGEGLGRLSREEAEADLRELKTRMEGRLRRPRAIWIPAAAAVVILLVSSGLLVTLLRDRPAIDSPLAQEGKSLEEVSPDDSTFLAITGEVANDTALIAMAQPIERTDRIPLAPVVSGINVRETVSEAADEMHAVVEENAVEEDVADEPVVVLMGVEAEMEEVIVQAVPQTRTSAMRARAVTETREVAVGRDEKKAVAEKDEAGKAEPAAGAVAPVIQAPATPLDGWEKYAEWAAGNIRYPAGVQPVVRQEVVVSFTVQPDSTLVDLKAVSSPGDLFTREAFRLLREGPKWVPASSGVKAVAEEVMVKVVFK